MILANALVETFLDGGPIMWPLLACLILALAVMAERALWWRRVARLGADGAFARALWDIRLGNLAPAWEATEGKATPYLRSLRSGLANTRTDPAAAMVLRAEAEVEESRRRLWVLGTLITLAPLLGLLGTVIGIMQSFDFIGGEQLAIAKVSGGVGEALIATAAGLGIAILCLLPHNLLARRSAELRHDLDQAISQAELALRAAAAAGHRPESFQPRETRAEAP